MTFLRLQDQTLDTDTLEPLLTHNNLGGLTTGDPHTQYQQESEKGAASGYASLDAGTLVPVAQIGTGTPDGTKYLRDDRTWVTPPGGGQAFPVGSVFIAVVSTNPGTLLGYGTWSAFGAGRVLVGLDSGDTDFDTVEETGGAKTVAAAGSNAAEAAHTHSVTSNVTIGNEAAHTHSVTSNVTVDDHASHVHNIPATGAAGRKIGTGATEAAVQTHTHTSDGPGSALTHTVNNPAVTSDAGSTHTHTPTNNAVTSGAGSSHNHAFTGSATSVVQPYIVCYFWKRTA